MKVQVSLTGVLLLLMSFSSPAAAECNAYSGQPTIDACVRHSLASPKAKREGYSEAGIRRWCEQHQPTCYKKKK
jgi:hypothetical protein